MMTNDELEKFAARYAEAWCSHDPEAVVAFYAENASISVNGGAPAPIAESRADATAFHWTLIGTNTGPGGSGKRVRISGYELWQIGNSRLIKKSVGHFDAAEYARQLREGVDG